MSSKQGVVLADMLENSTKNHNGNFTNTTGPGVTPPAQTQGNAVKNSQAILN